MKTVLELQIYAKFSENNKYEGLRVICKRTSKMWKGYNIKKVKQNIAKTKSCKNRSNFTSL